MNDKGKNDKNKDGGAHNVTRDGDTGRRGADEDHSQKIDPKEYGKDSWGGKE
ncbi:hypothetical protein [Amycolatopsis sp. NPDC059021]|uniref:hypothetical protein n=1 Tax=Amycolatopsis sp. NPDC059021 TaxID=3346704 RepID=UPI00366C83F3